MDDFAPRIRIIDTKLGGRDGITACYLVQGDRVAIVDPGAQTSAQTVRDALTAEGIGPDDLYAIVLTHIHLDHCGGTGDLAAAFPQARVVVHGRGARHLADPERLVTASAAVYGDMADVYGGLAATPEERIDVAPDDHVVDLGGGVALRMLETPGHAFHHMSVLETGSGTLMAGDALGVELARGGLYPSTPPAAIDVAAGRASIARLKGLGAATVGVAHFAAPTAADPFAVADELWGRMGDAALAGFREGGAEGAAARVVADVPMQSAVTGDDARALWEWLGWHRDNLDGLAAWADRHENPPPPK